MKNSQKGFIQPLIISIIVLALVVGGGWYLIYKNKKTQVNEPALFTFEGPGDLSVKVPKDFAQYLTGETKGYTNTSVGTKLTLGLRGDKGAGYFKDNNLYPNGAEYWITVGEQENNENSYCDDASYYNITSKKDYLINGYSFTQISEDDWDDGTYKITIFNATNKNKCRYVSLVTESVREDYIRLLAAENSYTDQKQIELTIKNTRISKEYFNGLSIEIAKTVSAK